MTYIPITTTAPPVGAAEAPAPASSDSLREGWLGGPAAFMAHYLRARRPAFAGVLLLTTGAANCAVGVQYATKVLVDAMAGAHATAVAHGQGHSAVRSAVIFFLALIAGETLLWRLSALVACKVTVRTGVDIRADLFEHVAGHPVRYFQDRLAGELGHRITAMAGHFGRIFNRLSWEITPPVVSFVGAMVIFATIDSRLAGTVAALTLATTAGMVALGLRGARLHQAHARERGRVGGELVDLVANIWSLKAFSAEARERARLEASIQREAEAHERSWLYTERVRAINDAALVVSAAATLLVALGLWDAGAISVGDVVVVSALTFRLLHGSRDLAFSLINVGQSWAYVGETLRLLGLPHAMADTPVRGRLERGGGSVRLEGVTFGYHPGRPVLERVNLHVPAGQRVGIVGASGAGKSTLLSLMMRFHDVDSGRILLDGQDIALVSQHGLRAAIAAVPQEVSLFHRTLRENIRFARPEATDAEVEAAARAAGCDAFIRALPAGYDTVVGERGGRLSGGQRQRVGIARAFLKNAPLVLLDEATSALDTRSELEVREALDRLMRGRTVLAVAHRLSTLATFDRILVLRDGRIVEDGSPRELRDRGGVFDGMWRLQAEALRVDTETLPGSPKRAAPVDWRPTGSTGRRRRPLTDARSR